ncbi:hypothetical protein FHS61_001472 [Altererythrobacter atlanticus]|nr:hypothetical protein [Croceibacterium atlanticum]
MSTPLPAPSDVTIEEDIELSTMVRRTAFRAQG